MRLPHGSIAGRQLAKLTAIKYDTLRRNLRRPAPIEKAVHPRYTINEVNAWLADSARGFVRPPMLSDLVSGAVELITAEDAVRLVPRFNEVLLYKRARQGKLRWVKLSYGLVRFCKASVLELAERPPFYTTSETCRILGVRRWTTINDMFVKTGMLPTINHPDNLAWPAVTEEALVAFLPYLLPRGDPVDWIDDRLADLDWPLHARDAAVYLGKTRAQLYSLINEGLPFIWAPSKTEKLFPVDALLYLVEAEPVLQAYIAHVFGVTPQAVSLWNIKGYLRCTEHRHAEQSAQDQEDEGETPTIYRACLIALLRRCLSPNIKAGVWLKARDRTTANLLTLGEAATHTNMSSKALVTAAENGVIGGIHTPTPTPVWRFSSRVARYAQQQ